MKKIVLCSVLIVMLVSCASLDGKLTEDEKGIAAVPVESETGSEMYPQNNHEMGGGSLNTPSSQDIEADSGSFSIGTSFISKSNINYKEIGWGSSFVAGAGLRTEAGLGDSFALGLKGQYDLSGYSQAAAFFRWIFLSRDKFDFYALLGGGVTFGVGVNKGQLTGLLEAGIGNDLSITKKFSVFEEIAVQWSIKNPGIEVAGSIGTKYTF